MQQLTQSNQARIITGLLALGLIAGMSAVLSLARVTEPVVITAVGAQYPQGTLLPELPLGNGTAFQAESDRIIATGCSAVASAGAEVAGPALQLHSGAADLAWALYRVDGLAGRKLVSLALDLSLERDSQYSVGLSNFSQGGWQFLALSDKPEYKVDFGAEHARFANEAGELYFVVAVSGGSQATLKSAAVLSKVAAANPGDLPASIGGLVASRKLADRVEVSWVPVAGARGYEIWRKTGKDLACQHADWTYVSTLRAKQAHYTDRDVTPGLSYEYQVRAVNSAGASAFCEPRTGYVSAGSGNTAASTDVNG